MARSRSGSRFSPNHHAARDRPSSSRDLGDVHHRRLPDRLRDRGSLRPYQVWRRGLAGSARNRPGHLVELGAKASPQMTIASIEPRTQSPYGAGLLLLRLLSLAAGGFWAAWGRANWL